MTLQVQAMEQNCPAYSLYSRDRLDCQSLILSHSFLPSDRNDVPNAHWPCNRFLILSLNSIRRVNISFSGP